MEESGLKFAKSVDKFSIEITCLKVRDMNNSKGMPQVNQLKIKNKSLKKIKCWKCGRNGHMQCNCKVKSFSNCRDFSNHKRDSSFVDSILSNHSRR